MSESASAPMSKRRMDPLLPKDDPGVRAKLMLVVIFGLMLASVGLYMAVRPEGNGADTTTLRTWQEPKQRGALFKDAISYVWETPRMAKLLRDARELFNIREFDNQETRSFLRLFATSLDDDTPFKETMLTMPCIESKLYGEDTCYMRTYLYILYRTPYSEVDLADRMAAFYFVRPNVLK